MPRGGSGRCITASVSQCGLIAQCLTPFLHNFPSPPPPVCYKAQSPSQYGQQQQPGELGETAEVVAISEQTPSGHLPFPDLSCPWPGVQAAHVKNQSRERDGNLTQIWFAGGLDASPVSGILMVCIELETKSGRSLGLLT